MSKIISSNFKTNWDLSPFYNSITDSRIEKDLKKAENAYTLFEKKYRKYEKYLKDDTEMFKALVAYEKLMKLKMGKVSIYLSFLQSLDSRNEKVNSMSNLMEQRINKIDNKILFFGVKISKIPKEIQNKFLSSKKLSAYKYFFECIFKTGKFTLTEPEEKILSLKSQTSYGMWVDSVSKVISKQTVVYKEKEIPISVAGSIIPNFPTQKERVDLYNKIVEKNLEVSYMAECELNAVITDKKVNDELRGFKKPFDATLLGYQNDEKSVLNLVKTVTDNFHIIHKFYKLKAKMLGLKKLKYPDRFANVGKLDKKISFEDSYKLLYEVFSSVDPEFGAILKRFAENGQIDVFPKVGKRGGAFCSHSTELPTYIFLNHTNNMDSLTTFAHEMGHGIHSEFSKKQPIFYEDYTISTAEVASTLFEAFVFYDQFEKLTSEEKIVALHDKISDDAGTIFAQIAFFNFEVEIHDLIRKNGSMTKEELASCFNKHTASYCGPVLDLEENNGYGYVGVAHFRYFFYVYTYAMGQIISKALYKKYSEDKTYIEKIKKFMSLGGSMSPANIFKSIGLDIKKEDFWKIGLKSIEEDINLLEKLINKK